MVLWVSAPSHTLKVGSTNPSHAILILLDKRNNGKRIEKRNNNGEMIEKLNNTNEKRNYSKCVLVYNFLYKKAILNVQWVSQV